ncbi:MAG: hypothetical protein WC943_03140 [Elusimicrobiota bacterium]|jgi:alpha-beta hydrolase superfamily lysophospholipase
MIFRALGVRLFERPAPLPVAREVPDLTTFSSREQMLPWEALAVAPPERFWTPLAGPVPGTLVEGSLPPEEKARFLLRVPKDWNGGLVVAASPGLLGEKAYDLYWSDFLLSKGFAFACMNKGLAMTADGDTFYVPLSPEASIRRWLDRFRALVPAASDWAAKAGSRKPGRVYAVGVSNGGYLVRRLLEASPELVDGGVEVSGVYWPEQGGGLLEQIPKALAATAGAQPDRPALRAAGFPADPDWDGVLAAYRAAFWTTSLAVFVGDLDPDFSGDPAAYDFSNRPQAAEAVRSIANTGRIGKPLISLAGGRDVLITAARHAEAYRSLVASRGSLELHELVTVADATHADADASVFPAVTPLMPEAHKAFERLVEKVEAGYSATSAAA